MAKVFEGPVWPLARNRMKNCAAMQYKNLEHSNRNMAAVLGCSIISFENI